MAETSVLALTRLVELPPDTGESAGFDMPAPAQLRRLRRPVLIASHVLPEIEQIANRVMIMLDGRLLTTDALALANDGQRLRLQVAGPEHEVRAVIAAVPGVRSIVIEPGSSEPDLRFLVEAEQQPGVAQRLSAALAERGVALSELTTVRPDLERIFLQLTRRPREEAA